jgi:hypothetical protein
MTTIGNSVDAIGKSNWMHFPGNRLVENPRLQSIAAKAIWLVIPLEYYILTRFNGGIAVDSYVSAAAMAVTCILAILLVSSVIALVYPRTGPYRTRVRGWAIALLAIWGTSLALLALSYLITFFQSDVPRDVIGEFICSRWKCVRYPGVTWQTLLAYVGYSFLASALITTVVRGVRVYVPTNEGTAHSEVVPSSTRPGRIVEPNIFVSAVIVATLMMLLHRASTLDSLPGALW